MSNRVRSFVLIAFVLLTALSLPPRVRGTSYSDVFPAALSNYAFGGWQGPFGDGTAGRLFPTSDGTGIYADATYNGLVWILRSSPEFSSIDMTMHFSIPNRDFTDADYFALLLILHSPTTPSSTPPGTNCDGTCSYVAGQSGFKLLYRIGFNQLVITNGPGNVTLSQVSLPPVALNQPHDARATYAAGNLTVYLDSVQLATLQIPNVPPGQIGFETYRTDLIVNTITLVGSVVPGFALSVNPARAVTGPSSSTNATMIVSSVGGFSGTVALSATASTSSLTPSLNPSSLVLAPGSNLTSTLTVDAGSFCGIGTVMVTGTSGSATSFVTFTVTVQCPFDYAVAWSPTSASITAPSSTTPSVVATLTSGTGTSVACTVTVPVANGLAASPTSFDITPAAAPGASSAVTISTTAVTPAGTYTIGVNCTGGAGTHAANFALTLCPCPFDYSLSVAPTTISLVQGTTSAPSTVSSLLVSGTSQPVTLSISGLPTGVIASMFTPNPVSPASPAATSTFTLTTAATAPVVSGVTITITGTSIGGLIRTTTFTLNSCSCGVDYSLSVAPTIVTLVQGTTSAASTVSALLVAGGAGMQTVTLSISGLPTGVTASAFTPNPVTPASPAATSTFTLTAAPTAPVVSGVTVTITGTSSGGIVRTTTFTLNCVCAFDYSLSVAPISVALIPGTTSAASTVSALLVAGTAQPVSLSISGLPTGVTASTFIPNPVTPASPAATSTFTLTAAATAPPVSGATVTITGTSTGGVVRTTTFTLNSCLGSFDYSLSVAPTSVTLVQGTTSTPSTVAALLVAACGGGQLVTLSFSGLPTGVTASVFTPNPVTPASPAVTSTFTLTASAMAPLVSGVIVTITGAPLGRTATFTLNVVGSFDYGLGVAPTSVTLVQGTTSAASTVFASLVAAGAGVQTVTLSISGLPTGVTASAFTPNPVTPSSPAATSTFTLTAAATAPVVSGVTVTITGTSVGGVVRTTTFALNLCSCIEYSLSVAPTTVTLVQATTSAASTVSALTVVAGVQPVALSISGLPTGVTASAFTPNPITPASPAATSTFSLTATATAPVVSGVTVTITGTSTGGVVRTTTFTLNVVASFDYSLSVAPTAVTLAPGTTSAPSTVSALLVATGAGVQTVTLSISGLPTGVTASAFTPNPVTPAVPASTSTFTLTASATAPVVSGLTVTITGTSTGGVIRTTTFSLNIVASRVPSVDFQPTRTLVGNTTFTSSITGGTAPFTCTWSFGDLTAVAMGCVLAHSYVSAGNFTVTLNVADSAGSTATVTHTVVVDPAPFLSKHFKFHDDSSWVKGENFTAIVTNPSAVTVTVTVNIDIFDEGAGVFVARLTGSALLAPGQVATITIHWSPPPVPAQYAFTAKIAFTNESFVTGTIATRTGLFQISSP